jgi:hypothetical protein
MSPLNPVGEAFSITTGATSAKSSAFSQRTDTIRIIAISNDAYVAIGTEPDAGPTNFLVTVGEPEEISLGIPLASPVAGITTGATTIIDFPEGFSSPFSVGDYVSLTVTGQSSYDFTHKEVTAVNNTANVGGYYSTRITVANDSSSGNPASLLSTSRAELRKSIKVAAEARTGTGSVHCQQVQVTG